MFGAARQFLTRAWREERLLIIVAIAHLAAVPIMVILAFLDTRVVLGQETWLKPIKFASSIGIYLVTFALLLLPVGRRGARTSLRWMTAVSLSVEMVLILTQAARGTRSHFNDDSAVDIAVFSAMGIAILLATVALIILLGLYFTSQLWSRPVSWAIRAGIILSLAGSAIGGVMIAHGGHTANADDGGPGLPIIGWSNTAGDFRPAHFVGLHALQVMPLIGVMAHIRLPERRAMTVIAISAILYAGLVGTLFFLALSGRPI